MRNSLETSPKQVDGVVGEKGRQSISFIASIRENPKSLLLFSPENPVRRLFKTVITHTAFDNFILLCIILNSIMLAIVDYEYVDEEGNPSTKGSSRNQVVEAFEPFFTWTFVLEMTLKVIAQGFILQKDAYLSFGWNRLDFIIVITSLLALLPNFPNLSVFRTFRVLRPLRSLSRFPGLRSLISALLKSIPGLIDVVLLLCFVLVVFSILGVQFFSGLLHARCRVTPFPIRMNESITSIDSPLWNDWLLDVIQNPDPYRCLDVPNNDETKTFSTSPWHEPQNCIWPVYEEDDQVCSLSDGGWHSCSTNASISLGSSTIYSKTHCGSNYDLFGNARFLDKMQPFHIPRL